MRWYAVHMVQYFKRREGRQRSFLVWENIVLFRAANPREAFEKAKRMGREEEALDDPSLRLNDRLVKKIFAGVRKVVECVDSDKRPNNRTEVSYTEMVLPSEKAVRNLVAGKAVNVRIVDFLSDD
jgi:hypothetical protein